MIDESKLFYYLLTSDQVFEVFKGFDVWLE